MWYHGDVTEPLVSAIRADAQRMMGSNSRRRALPSWTPRPWGQALAEARVLAVQALVR